MKTQEIQNLIKEILEKMDITVKEISILEGEEASLQASKPKTIWYKVDVSHPHLFTAREGEALSALNHLIRRITESKIPEGATNQEAPILVDIGDFQKKRVDNIKAVAHMMAERARYFKSNIEVDPMSAFDRRIVHEFLSEATDLKTESMGFGPSRRVVIKYIGSI